MWGFCVSFLSLQLLATSAFAPDGRLVSLAATERQRRLREATQHYDATFLLSLRRSNYSVPSLVSRCPPVDGDRRPWVDDPALEVVLRVAAKTLHLVYYISSIAAAAVSLSWGCCLLCCLSLVLVSPSHLSLFASPFAECLQETAHGFSACAAPLEAVWGIGEETPEETILPMWLSDPFSRLKAVRDALSP